jgi:SAM-dependent methyltransferase
MSDSIMNDITFADIPSREKFLASPEALYLLGALGPDIARKLEECFLSTGLAGKDIREVHVHFVEHSDIIRIVTASPSSAETFEYLYHKRPVEKEIDPYFLRAKAAIGIKQRLMALKRHLPDIIRNEISRLALKKGERFVVFNVGSGPGHDMIEVLHENRELSEVVRVVCIDPDAPMLEIGERRVKELGLSNSFDFVPHKFSDVDLGKSHMVLMIGILCPMPQKACIKILKNTSNFVYPSGTVVYNTVQTRMVKGDPLCDFIMRMAGWHMDYKKYSTSIEIARLAGLRPESSFFDSLGYNCMVVARPVSE